MGDKPTALVTGAGWWPDYDPGIGLALAREMAERGHRVLVTDRELAPAQRSVEQLKTEGLDARAAVLDVTDKAQCKGVLDQLIADEGRLDTLVNAAALTLARWGLKQFHDIQPEQCDQEIEVTLKGALNVTRAALPAMYQRGAGSIIFISSVMGYEPSPQMSIYGLSKAALINFTMSLAAEAGPRGIRVNAICPGVIKTRVTNRMPPQHTEKFLRNSALHRVGEPSEIAKVAGFLVSDAASFVTGQAIRVDGGSMGIV